MSVDADIRERMLTVEREIAELKVAAAKMEAAQREQLHHYFEEMHELGGYLLAALVVLHVLGALKHQLIDRESEMERMWFVKRGSN